MPKRLKSLMGLCVDAKTEIQKKLRHCFNHKNTNEIFILFFSFWFLIFISFEGCSPQKNQRLLEPPSSGKTKENNPETKKSTVETEKIEALTEEEKKSPDSGEMEEQEEVGPTASNPTESEWFERSAFYSNPTIEKICKAIMKEASFCKNLEIDMNENVLNQLRQIKKDPSVLGTCYPPTPDFMDQIEDFEKNYPQEKEKLSFYQTLKEITSQKKTKPWILLSENLSSEERKIAVAHEYAHYLFDWGKINIRSEFLPQKPLVKDENIAKEIEDSKESLKNQNSKTEKELSDLSQLVEYYSRPTEEFAFTFQSLCIIEDNPTLFEGSWDENSIFNSGKSENSKEKTDQNLPEWEKQFFKMVFQRAMEWRENI